MVNVYPGGQHHDERGVLLHNNPLDLSRVKRSYLIQNATTDLVRGWRGHRIETRWFICVWGKTRIWVAPLDALPNPDFTQFPFFDLDASSYDCLEVPPGHATAFQSLIPDTRLQCFSDYSIGDVQDDVLFPIP